MDRGVELACPISSSGVRVLYNRLEAVGALYDRSLSGARITFSRKTREVVIGVPVRIEVSMDARYDEAGVLDEARGDMTTDVLTCSGGRCRILGFGEIDFSISPMLSEARSPLLSRLVSYASLLSIALSLLALHTVLARAKRLEIVA